MEGSGRARLGDADNDNLVASENKAIPSACGPTVRDEPADWVLGGG
jgi:hypothetical protein